MLSFLFTSAIFAYLAVVFMLLGMSAETNITLLQAFSVLSWPIWAMVWIGSLVSQAIVKLYDYLSNNL